MSFLDLLRTLERITRPPRRDDGPAAVLSDECRAPGPSDCLSCGKRCAWPADVQRREKAARLTAGLVAFALDPDAGERPDFSCGLGDGVKLREHWSSCAVWDDDQVAKLAEMEAEIDRLKADRGTGAINDGEPQQVTLSGREYERYLDGALNEPYAEPDDEESTCYFCGEPTESIVDTDHGAEYVCDGCSTPNPTEPALTDDELVAVRGLIQERYPEPDWWCAWCGRPTRLTLHGPTEPCPDSPAASAAGVSPAGVEHPPVPPAGPLQPLDDDVIEITLHRADFIPDGNGAFIAYSDDFPGKQFLILPKN